MSNKSIDKLAEHAQHTPGPWTIGKDGPTSNGDYRTLLYGSNGWSCGLGLIPPRLAVPIHRYGELW